MKKYLLLFMVIASIVSGNIFASNYYSSNVGSQNFEIKIDPDVGKFYTASFTPYLKGGIADQKQNCTRDNESLITCKYYNKEEIMGGSGIIIFYKDLVEHRCLYNFFYKNGIIHSSICIGGNDVFGKYLLTTVDNSLKLEAIKPELNNSHSSSSSSSSSSSHDPHTIKVAIDLKRSRSKLLIEKVHFRAIHEDNSVSELTNCNLVGTEYECNDHNKQIIGGIVHIKFSQINGVPHSCVFSFDARNHTLEGSICNTHPSVALYPIGQNKLTLGFSSEYTYYSENLNHFFTISINENIGILTNVSFSPFYPNESYLSPERIICHKKNDYKFKCNAPDRSIMGGDLHIEYQGHNGNKDGCNSRFFFNDGSIRATTCGLKPYQLNTKKDNGLKLEHTNLNKDINVNDPFIINTGSVRGGFLKIESLELHVLKQFDNPELATCSKISDHKFTCINDPYNSIVGGYGYIYFKIANYSSIHLCEFNFTRNSKFSRGSICTPDTRFGVYGTDINTLSLGLSAPIKINSLLSR